jgi:hypothetical protein
MYIMRVKDFSYSSAQKSVSISTFLIQPRLNEKDYAYKLPFQKERNEIAIHNIKLEGLDIESFMKNGEVIIQRAAFDSGHWNIYLSRIPPLPKLRTKVVPTQPLLSISHIITIDTLRVNKLQLDYREYNTATGETGEVRFNDISGTASNITNEKDRIAKNAHLIVNLSARLMGTGEFKSRFDFLLSDTTGKFSVVAQLGKMNAIQFNPGFIPLNKLEIKKGVIDQLTCMGSGNQNGIKGDVSLLYHDLHIAVMEKDKKTDTFKRKGFVSLVANILVKNDNPQKDEPVRTAHNIVLKRDPRKSYFNLLWMALFTGIGQIASGKITPP